jgi:hypothetical protein
MGMDLGTEKGRGGLKPLGACKTVEEDWIRDTGFHQSQTRNESGRKGWVGRGLARPRRESLQSVRLKRAESERKNVMRMGATNPTLLNHG